MKPLQVAALAATCLTWPLALSLWQRHEPAVFAVPIFLLGLSLGPLLAVYASVRTARKQRARRAVLFAGGLSILTFALAAGENLDLEGFFLVLLTGACGACSRACPMDIDVARFAELGSV
jgi:hypothetical protein